MSEPAWTRAQLEDLVAGLTLNVRAADAGDLPVRGWLADAAGCVGQLSSAERIEARHPDDQTRMTDGWIGALVSPGVPQEFSYRTLIDGQWHDERCILLNLLDHPDVGGMLVLSETIGPAVEAADGGEDIQGDYESARWIAYRIDRFGIVLEMDGMCESLLGISPEEAIGRNSLDFASPSSKGRTVQMWLDLLAHPGSTHTGQLHLVGADGVGFWLDVTLFHRVAPDGTSDVLVVGRDVTDERARQDELRERYAELHQLAEEFRLLADEVPAAVFRCDGDGRLTFHNERWSQLPGVVEGITRLQDVISDQDRSTLDASISELLPKPDLDGCALELVGRDGRSVFAVSIRAVGTLGSIRRSLVGAITDITAEVALRARAEHDPVTGLLNRQAIEERVALALSRETQDVTVAFADLDGFKGVNDAHGHAAGDEVLAEIGRRLEAAVRNSDDVGRYGGDEFVVIAYGAGPAPVLPLDRRLAHAFDQPVIFGGGVWSPKASIGQARAVPGDTVASVIGRADQSMYAMKRTHRIDAERLEDSRRSPVETGTVESSV